MATQAKKSAAEVTVEEKLRALYRLQLIDSAIDKIRTIRGELPLEVEDLQDEIAGLETRINNLQSELDEMEHKISDRKNSIVESKDLIKKYEEQQKNVRNNREFDSISKEMEFQSLEIQLSEKRLREFQAQVEQKREIITAAELNLSERAKDLEGKQAELDGIIKETQKEEKALLEASKEAEAHIEDRLLNAYHRIRSNVKNGLAVVAVERGSSGGSFIKIPPQRQMDIAARKKIITDEHSGRILVDAELAVEEGEKLKMLTQNAIMN
jgi:predicted  nucleic acid-binding Zn-ribbon protein